MKRPFYKAKHQAIGFKMKGKYKNTFAFSAAYLSRKVIRFRIRNSVEWTPAAQLQDGLTVIIGMPYRLSGILKSNLRCLYRNRWRELERIIVSVDAAKGVLPDAMMENTKLEFPNVPIDFVFYDDVQSALARKLELPYVYSWLSWCVAIARVQTKHILIHDYDALIMDDILAKRYEKFVSSNALIQGISWYGSNGIDVSDQLATTFEAFVDTNWIRSFKPIMLFNQVSLHKGRSVDYDTLLEIQHRHTAGTSRKIEAMSEGSLVHPSQMIHQYTMFRRSPKQALPCFSIGMIPFFLWLSGDKAILETCTQRLLGEPSVSVDLLGDGTRINFTKLSSIDVDWNLKQMIIACTGLAIQPFRALLDYGNALYRITKTPDNKAWIYGFSDQQLNWINAASSLNSSRS
jgi:hypothetical protein